MRVIGIDPGLERIGYAIVDVEGHKLSAVEFGCVMTSSKLDVTSRLKEIKNDLEVLIKKYRPKKALIEQLMFVHNATSALGVAQARGVILLVLGEQGISIEEKAPAEVKKAVAGNGAADKKQIAEAVKLIYGLTEAPKPDDAADALALAACYQSRVE